MDRISSARQGPLSIGLFGQFDEMIASHLSSHRVAAQVTPQSRSLASLMPSLDGIVIRSPFKLDDECALRANRLQWIIRAGSGTDNISPLFHDRGVTVRTTPINAHSVAELVIGLTLALLRHVRPAHQSLRAGLWNKQSYVGGELRGKTVGILGFGRIGREVAALMRAFDTRLLAYDRSPDAAEKQLAAVATGTRLTGIETVVAESDIVVAALPGSEQTRHLFDRALFRQMRTSALLVNVGRGSLVELDALEAALDDRLLAGAALDVFSCEPPGKHRLFDMDNVLCTPHLGAQTRETHRAIGKGVIAHLRELIPPDTDRADPNRPFDIGSTTWAARSL